MRSIGCSTRIKWDGRCCSCIFGGVGAACTAKHGDFVRGVSMGFDARLRVDLAVDSVRCNSGADDRASQWAEIFKNMSIGA